MVVPNEVLDKLKSKDLRFLIKQYNTSVDKSKVKVPVGAKTSDLRKIVNDNFNYNKKQFKHKSGRFTMSEKNMVSGIAAKAKALKDSAPARKIARDQKKKAKKEKEDTLVGEGVAKGAALAKARAAIKTRKAQKGKQMTTSSTQTSAPQNLPVSKMSKKAKKKMKDSSN